MSNPRITRIELPTIFGMKTVNSYLIQGSENVLIDSGEDTPECFQAMREALNSKGLKFTDISKIIITHAHVDHMGMANKLAQAAGAEVWVSELVLPWAVEPHKMWQQREGLMIPSLLQFFPHDIRPLVKSNYSSFMSKVTQVWHPIDQKYIRVYSSSGKIDLAGDLWEVLYMPGHSQTQSAFFHRSSGSFLSADMLLKITPTPVIEPDINNLTKRKKGIIDMMESYNQILDLPIQTVYPGHYKEFDEAHNIINYQMSRISKRAAQCLEIIRTGNNSFFDIFQVMYEGRFHMPALIMLIGYLDLLEFDDKIDFRDKEGYLQAFAR